MLIMAALLQVADQAERSVATRQPDQITASSFDLAAADKLRALQTSRSASCSSTDTDEVVVCGRRSPGYRIVEQADNAQPMMDRISDALVLRLGPLRFGSFKKRDGTRAFGLTSSR